MANNAYNYHHPIMMDKQETDLMEIDNDVIMGETDYSDTRIPETSANILQTLLQQGKIASDKLKYLLQDRDKDADDSQKAIDNEGQIARINDSSSTLNYQDEVNKATATLSRLNYLVNLANLSKNQNVEESLRQGYKALSTMQSKISQQASSISHINQDINRIDCEVQNHDKVSQEMRQAIAAQEQTLKNTVNKIQKELHEHKILVAKQQKLEKELLQKKIRQDFMVDGSLTASAIFLVNSFFVDFPLNVALSVINARKTRIWLRNAIKIIIVLRFYAYFKPWLIQHNIHNRVGSMKKYAIELFYMMTGKPSLLSTTHADSKEQITQSTQQVNCDNLNGSQQSYMSGIQTPVKVNSNFPGSGQYPSSPYYSPFSQHHGSIISAYPIDAPAHVGHNMYTPVQIVASNQDTVVPVSPNYRLTDVCNNYRDLDGINQPTVQMQQVLPMQVATASQNNCDSMRSNLSGLLSTIAKFSI
ncbi:hypothetical protein TrispH2_007965 [Trichoplax sp. H2]|nr:hypothetical protein TrispH2_007965 [Trichoplax sp. H2]|eukprot:RDD40131.1 hypothetical protein TrispH2_007965 [Trichoplax sp. H2]